MSAPLRPKHQGYKLAVLVTVGLAYGHHHWIYGPWKAERENLETRLVLLETRNLEDRKGLIAQDGALETHVTALAGRLRELESRLPERRDLQPILSRVQAEAEDQGLRVLSFRPGDRQTDGPYLLERAKLTVEGRYLATGKFLSATVSMSTWLRPMDVRMELVSGGPMVRTSLALETYQRPWEGMLSDPGMGEFTTMSPDFGFAVRKDESWDFLRDPIDLQAGTRPGSGLEGFRLRAIVIAQDPEASLAGFEPLDTAPRRDGIPPASPRLVRVRQGDRLGNLTILRILAQGVEVHADREGAMSANFVFIPLERRTPRKTGQHSTLPELR